MAFADLGLSPKVLAAIDAAGYTEPTEIQLRAIPPALERKDVLGIAQTGTGKTAAFTLPMLTQLERGRARARMPRSLVMEPTRELAAQVAEALETYGKNHKLTVALLIGGVSFAEQDRKLDRGADILIATPGRLLDHFERGKLMLNGVQILVVDEADRMLDMGFIPDIERIFKLTPFTRQTLFFSATMPPEIQRLTDAFLHNPVRVEAAPPASTVDTLTQWLVKSATEPKTKRLTLRKLLDAEDVGNAIVFCNRKRDVRTLVRSLERHGYNAGAIHGDMDQHARMETLARFKDQTLKILVASDVAARGLDIPTVSHVFNYDVPHHAEDYVHRVGRTGRAGRSGIAFSLVTPADTKSIAAIEALIKQKISWAGEKSPGEADQPEAAPTTEAATSKGSSRRRRGGRSAEPQNQTQEKSTKQSDTKQASGARAKADKPTTPAKPAAWRGDTKPAPKPAPKTAPKTADNVIFAETAYVPDFLRRSVKAEKST
ncbi:MAG: DEAD/DEAH box helicase [Alphaproteobacteria bacterium]